MSAVTPEKAAEFFKKGVMAAVTKHFTMKDYLVKVEGKTELEVIQFIAEMEPENE